MPSKKHVKLCHQLICFAFMTINCIVISKWYFEYRVTIKVGPSVPFDMYFPKLSLCFSLTSLLSRVRGDFFSTNTSFFLNKKISELKSATPRADDIIEECVHREWGTNSIVFKSGPECHKFFKVSIYLMQSYMCYKFTPRHMLFSFYDVTHTLEERRLLYGVTINAPLNVGHKMCPMLHYRSVPYDDRWFSQEILPSRAKGEKFILTNDIYQHFQLPPPYSRCGLTSEASCYTHCMMNRIKRYGLIHYPATVFNTNDSLILPDFETKYSGRYYNEIHDEFRTECDQMCGVSDECQLTLSVTLTSRVPHSKPGKLIFEILSLSKPMIQYETTAATNLIEFFTQISSVCSFSVGFSVLSLITSNLNRPSLSKVSLNLIAARMKVTSMVNDLRPGQTTPRKTSPVSRTVSKKRLLSLFASISVRIIIAVALSVQMFEIWSDYFKFETRTQIYFDNTPYIQPPILNVCLFKDTEKSVNKFGEMNSNNYDQALLERGFTKPAIDMINSQYSTEELINGCRIASNNRSILWALTLRDTSQCLRDLIVHKYLLDDHLCFGISQKNETSVHQGTKKFAIVHPGLFYSIILNSSLSRRKLRVMLSDEHLPVVSKQYSSDIPSRWMNRLYLVSNHLRKTYSLPAPYDTRCRNSTSSAECQRQCLINKTIDKLNFLPYGQVLDEETLTRHPKLSILTYRDLKDPFINRAWVAIEDQCFTACSYQPCNSSTSKTFISLSHPSRFKLEIATDSRAHPDQLTKNEARTSLYVMLYNILCCVNFWLGLVLLGLLPLKTTSEKLKERIIITLNRNLCLLQSDLQKLNLMPASLSFVDSKTGIKKLPQKAFLWAFVGIGCSLHLYSCTRAYLNYPTIMNTYSKPDEATSNDYELSVCNSILETLIPGPAQAYYEGKMSREDFDRVLSRSLSDSEGGSLIKNEGIKMQSLDSCSLRGADNRPDLPRHLKDVTDRLFVAHTDCHAHFYSKISSINGFLCHRFGVKGDTASRRLLPLNRPKALLIFKLRLEDLTRSVSVAISRKNYFPYYSSFWSPTFVKPETSMKIKLSYVKYEQNILPKPYDNGFKSVASIGCFQYCLISQLNPFKPNSSGDLSDEAISASTLQYLINKEKDADFRRRHERVAQRCREECLQTIGYSTEKMSISFTVTSLIEFGAYNSSSGKFVEFFLTLTDSPVTNVTIQPQWSLFELIIDLGSILSIWLGISACSFDPLARKKPSIDWTVMERYQLV